MTPWFGPEAARWFAFFSLFSLFSLLSYFIKQGRHRRIVTLVLTLCAMTGVVILALAIIANMVGQPSYVVFPLAVAGVVLSAVFLMTLWKLPDSYSAAELRSMAAQEI